MTFLVGGSVTLNHSEIEAQLKKQVVQSAKVLLDFNYRLGVEASLQEAVEAIESSDDASVAFDEIADDDPGEAIYVLMSGIEILFHGHRMHSAKADLCALRKKYGK
jgi:hypothetical protein